MAPGRRSSGARHEVEPRWPATLAVVVALVLYATLPDALTYGPRWLLPAVEGAIIVPLSIGVPRRHPGEGGAGRVAAIVLIAIANVANVVSLGLLIHELLRGASIDGRTLVFSAIQIYLTNVIVFGLWYWELDRGGPAARLRSTDKAPDFLFPQMVNPTFAAAGWRPAFFDYLFTSLTNATAFSPTDTMPMSHMAKGLFGVQSLASLLTVALVAGRAVNILH